MSDWTHVWRWRRWKPPGATGYIRHEFADRVGQRCRVLARGRSMNSVAIEFDDGHRAVVSRYAIIRARCEPAA